MQQICALLRSLHTIYCSYNIGRIRLSFLFLPFSMKKISDRPTHRPTDGNKKKSISSQLSAITTRTNMVQISDEGSLTQKQKKKANTTDVHHCK